MRNHRLPRGYAALLSLLCIMYSFARSSAADQEDLLSLARAGHRAARQSIHSFSATISTEAVFPNQSKIVHSGQYWRSFDVVRIQEKADYGTEDFLLKDSEVRQVGRGTDVKTGEKYYAASRKASTAVLSMLDVWSLMMIDFGGPDGGHYDLDRFLEFAKEPPRASRERKDGCDCIRITFSVVSSMGEEQNLTLWHDVAHNYLVRKTIMTADRNNYKVESDVLEFAEPLPGVFFPTKKHAQVLRKNELYSTQDAMLSNLRVNEPIPKSVFQLPAIPAGIELHDHIQGTRYPIDENWQPIGPAQPLVIARVPNEAGRLPSEYQSQSKSEGRSFIWWLVSGSLAVLVAACGYGVYRRLLSRRASNQAD